MNNVQNDLLTMYIDIKRILDEHNIKHYVICGSALGAIRHNGFIPWDDDIDIGVFDEDIERINKLLSSELDLNKYYYHKPIVDSHPHIVMKSEDTENEIKNKKALFIDIFQFRKYPSGKIRRKLFNFLICMNVLSIYSIEKVDNRYFTKIFAKFPALFEKMTKSLPEKDSEYVINFSTTYKKEIFKKDDFGIPQMHAFESIEVPLPNNVTKMMQSLYGDDYMTPPPEDKRKGAAGYPVNIYWEYKQDMAHKL